ncbi:hypothetical protein QOM21_36035 [Streptomyces sp. Pv4-95]
MVKRYKTMGIVVPLWVPGPCSNLDCPHHVPESQRDGRERSEEQKL